MLALEKRYEKVVENLLSEDMKEKVAVAASDQVLLQQQLFIVFTNEFNLSLGMPPSGLLHRGKWIKQQIT
jgi:hypothetical protein